ncbi:MULTISPECIES: tRNA-dependent cyclodipeptide synthase [Actinomadura]|uniref:Cyclodipeptide synthase n=1 Tax=Actinomadura yumaensis TaxID=111807 RepID=A0ABW2CEE2_9ACTN|nr:tRNA-dependent cyclodipeptide synthase [Actinomadura sp. J1-007]MWK38385.1 tRNA-dependent cyclodipeptide synthase [Actinomadura sp. J1-007]
MDEAGAGNAASWAVVPYTSNCEHLCERAEHVLVGVSPGNGYFNRERLAGLLRWAGATFARVDAIVPDASLVHTYQALGQSPATAWKNASRKAGKTCRRIVRAWEQIGVPQHERRLHLLSEFMDHPVYVRLRAQVEKAIGADPVLREAFLEASRRVLQAYLNQEPTDEQVEESKNYLAAEMPLCLDTPAILDVPSSVNVYHQRLPTLERMFTSPHMDVSPLQGHAVVRPPADRPGAEAENPAQGRDHV